jgi:hypothetical protein
MVPRGLTPRVDENKAWRGVVHGGVHVAHVGLESQTGGEVGDGLINKRLCHAAILTVPALERDGAYADVR